MQTINDVVAAQRWVMDRRAQGKTVGVVPTMGALHQGHLSLAKLSRRQCDHTIATIFVNPTQFGPNEDLAKYPRTLQQDCERLESESVDAVFVPNVNEMYPDGYSTSVNPPSVSTMLEGECRPGHFEGVATVVLKLFQIIPATHAFFGRKDYQQFKVIEAMVRDFNVGIKLVAGETIREPDGLALSSRNRYLSDSDRQRALLLSAALCTAQKLVQMGERDADVLQAAMQRCLSGENGQGGVDRIDYAVVVNSQTLLPINKITSDAVALIAAMVGQTRLIDNQTLTS
ncbi:MAG: pantoate--beta-alanine ligase [Pirellulaceae bacterium]